MAPAPYLSDIHYPISYDDQGTKLNCRTCPYFYKRLIASVYRAVDRRFWGSSVLDAPHEAATFIFKVLPVLSLQGCKVIPAGAPLACGAQAPQHSLRRNSNARLLGITQQGAVHLGCVLQQGLQLGASLAILSLKLYSQSKSSLQEFVLGAGSNCNYA